MAIAARCAASGSLTLDGAPIAVEGESGPLLGLTDPMPGTPWPIRLTSSPPAARPRRWRAASTGRRSAAAGRRSSPPQVPDTQALVPLLPDVPLLPLHDVRARIGLADAGPGRQALTGLDVSIGASPLDPLLPGLALAGLSAKQAGPEAPLGARRRRHACAACR